MLELLCSRLVLFLHALLQAAKLLDQLLIVPDGFVFLGLQQTDDLDCLQLLLLFLLQHIRYTYELLLFCFGFFLRKLLEVGELKLLFLQLLSQNR